jgi:hypothetical protein
LRVEGRIDLLSCSAMTREVMGCSKMLNAECAEVTQRTQRKTY